MLTAFLELDRARQFVATPTGPMPQPITWESIAAWCDLNGVHDADERRHFARLIRAADRTRFEQQETKQDE
ncbi:MAG: hypothetical protein IT459_21950 [Planctomycetes bacterium]|nr:hypothetical protein [Planctomycetota bacterium]